MFLKDCRALVSVYAKGCSPQEQEQEVISFLNKQDAALLIPAYEPNKNLIKYIREAENFGFDRIIVVDDGSNDRYAAIFEAIKNFPSCTLLTQPCNKGKGAALKRGFEHILSIPDIKGVVCVDSDGQHLLPDVENVARHMKIGCLTLGGRDFSQAGVPAKSRWGNKVSSGALRVMMRRSIPDTQTGLRAIPLDLIPRMLSVKGSRFEYETNMLIECARAGIPIETVPIATVYYDNNEKTHYRAVRDSWHISRVVIVQFLKFSLSSLSCSVVDMALAWMLLDLFADLESVWQIFFATIIARLVSIVVNYAINQRLVFRYKQNALVRYLCLCAVVMGLSIALVTLVSGLFGIDPKWAKVVCDTLLFGLSYLVQRTWVFAERSVHE